MTSLMTSWMNDSGWAKNTLSRRDLPPLHVCKHCNHRVPFSGDLTGKYCPHCGKKNPDRLERVEELSRPRCPHCSAERQTGRYCMECGKLLRE